ncbi:acyl-CoA thioesterase [Psychrobacter frigidicola]|uniref:Acyl-CoA thioesterase n=1 Tax=Psychrobacter frigidicola TaxID=45611 RepID=A0A5C6ZZT1_9GAMM|nr:acyl-CoA thioesterase [Psychrobacter frigidicola]TXD96601.1 acyl-CoA thioesterase [Psychrobacter frigidicola]
MNMLLRFFMMSSLLKQQLNKQSVGVSLSNEVLTASTVRHYRVLPHDMGFRNHLPNYRYLSFIELNITQWLLACCHQKGLKGVQWIIAMQEVIYLKEIKFLDKMTVTSMVVGWDNKYVYFEHRFFVKNQLMAVGMTKFVLMNNQGKCKPSVLDMVGEQLTDVITSWNTHQTAVKSAPTS